MLPASPSTMLDSSLSCLPPSGQVNALRMRRRCLARCWFLVMMPMTWQRTSCSGTVFGWTGTARAIPLSLQMRGPVSRRDFQGALTSGGQNRSRIESKALDPQAGPDTSLLTMRPSSRLLTPPPILVAGSAEALAASREERPSRRSRGVKSHAVPGQPLKDADQIACLLAS